MVCRIVGVFKQQWFILDPERGENMIIYAEWKRESSLPLRR